MTNDGLTAKQQLKALPAEEAVKVLMFVTDMALSLSAGFFLTPDELDQELGKLPAHLRNLALEYWAESRLDYLAQPKNDQ